MAVATGWLELGDGLVTNSEWVRFFAASGAVILTFLAGAELDPEIVRTKLAEVSAVGLVSFLGPFLGCAAVAYCLLGWDTRASWLAGVALSTTSMAVGVPETVLRLRDAASRRLLLEIADAVKTLRQHESVCHTLRRCPDDVAQFPNCRDGVTSYV